jgi:hypothetical protein
VEGDGPDDAEVEPRSEPVLAGEVDDPDDREVAEDEREERREREAEEQPPDPDGGADVAAGQDGDGRAPDGHRPDDCGDEQVDDGDEPRLDAVDEQPAPVVERGGLRRPRQGPPDRLDDVAVRGEHRDDQEAEEDQDPTDENRRDPVVALHRVRHALLECHCRGVVARALPYADRESPTTDHYTKSRTSEYHMSWWSTAATRRAISTARTCQHSSVGSAGSMLYSASLQ